VTPPEPIARLTAALADRYRIERELGTGGMATVYLAQDIRHGRQVAVKVLKPELAASLGPERFLREIEVAARLTHPHILPLHDSGAADGFLYYVMPYIDGESLRRRLDRAGELPIPEAVRILREVADALAYAHEQGVVHRDIKPDNVLISGRHALVMDFGVAKAVSEAPGRQALTTLGVALGTPAYMAPEQAAADPHVDYRADIYALGVMGYELVTGRPPFSGGSPQQVLAAHITTMPVAVTVHRPAVPERLANVIMRALEKKPADRWQSAEEMLNELEPLSASSGGITPAETRPVKGMARPSPSRRWVAAAAVAFTALVILGAVAMQRRGAPPLPALDRMTRLTNTGGLEVHPAISPDGRYVAYTHLLATGAEIFLQPVDGGRAINVTDSAPGFQVGPDWSPDGTRLVFMEADPDGMSIQTMPPTGGSPRTLRRYRGFAYLVPRWSPDGRQIAFTENDSILVMNPDGSGVRLVARLAAAHSLAWSPDGKWLAGVRENGDFAYSLGNFGNLAAATVFVVPAAGGTPRMVSDSLTLNISPVWLRDGRGILYISNGGGGRDVYEQRINSSGAPDGPPRRITTGLDAQTISLSADGRRIAYSKYSRDINIWSLRVPPGGHGNFRDAVPVTRGNQAIESVQLSPDRKFLAYDSDLNGNADVFVVPTDGGAPRQITDNKADDLAPSWSPDGSQLVFHSFRTGNRDLFTVNADGSGVTAVTNLPGNQRNAVWRSSNAIGLMQSNATGGLDAEEVTRAAPSAPWGAPKMIAPGFFLQRPLPGGQGYLATGDSGVYRLVPGNPPQPVFVDRQLVISVAVLPPPGRTLYIEARAADGREFIGARDLSGGPIRRIIDLPERPIGLRTFDTDGTRFFFNTGQHQADIWVADVVTQP
jgi:serine/threonine-protein kinase